MICVGIERPFKKHAGGMFLGRGRFPWLPDASCKDVDGSQNQTSINRVGSEGPFRKDTLVDEGDDTIEGKTMRPAPVKECIFCA